jgi:hypothetical protein
VSDVELSPAAERTGHLDRHHFAWPAWLPKTVLVTAALTLVTAWVFPALSHQWQDRQKARELTAALVTQIGRETSQALITSDFLSSNRLPSQTTGQFNREAFNQLDLDWRNSSAQIEAELQAYYSTALVQRWRTYARLVQHAYFLPTPDRYSRPGTLTELSEHFGPQNASDWNLRVLRTPWVGQTQRSRTDAVIAYLHVTGALLGEKEKLIDDILHDHPAGFSTRPSDIVHDLLPF